MKGPPLRHSRDLEVDVAREVGERSDAGERNDGKLHHKARPLPFAQNPWPTCYTSLFLSLLLLVRVRHGLSVAAPPGMERVCIQSERLRTFTRSLELVVVATASPSKAQLLQPYDMARVPVAQYHVCHASRCRDFAHT